jgi:hypothetical protein
MNLPQLEMLINVTAEPIAHHPLDLNNLSVKALGMIFSALDRTFPSILYSDPSDQAMHCISDPGHWISFNKRHLAWPFPSLAGYLRRLAIASDISQTTLLFSQRMFSV